MTYAVRTVDNGTGTDYNVAVDAFTTPDRDYLIQKIMVGGEGVASPLIFGQATMAASLPVVLSSDQSTLPVRQQDQTQTGTITANGQTVVLTGLAGASAVGIDVRGTFVATLQFEATIDGTNWFAVNAVVATTGALVTSTAAAGAWQADVAGYAAVRVRCSAFTSGTVNISLRASNGAGVVALDAPLPTGSNTIGAVTMTSTTLTAVTPGTAATNLGKAQDAVMGATDTGVAFFGVRRDAPTALTPIAGDYAVPQISQQGAQYVHPTFSGSAGATQHTAVSAATTNGTSVKASAGVLTSVIANNASLSAWRYLKLHNLAAAPTVGSTPVTFVIPIPPQGVVALEFPSGLSFSTGIAYSITGGSAAADATAVAVGDVNVSLAYH